MSGIQAQNFNEVRDREKRNRKLSFRILYNPADEKRQFSHAGVPYVIPPDGPLKDRLGERESISEPGIVEDRGDHALYDGTLKVYDRYGVSNEDFAKYRKAMRRGGHPKDPIPNKHLAASLDIAEHAVRKVGKSGVVMLTGDPKEDALLKRQAKDLWVSFKVQQVERIIRNYQTRVANFHANPQNRGQYAPAMDEVERGAQRWYDEYRLGLQTRKLFVCPENCGFQDDNKKTLDVHLQASHPMTWAAQQAEAEDEKPKGKKTAAA